MLNLVLNARVLINDLEEPYDGGRVVLHADSSVAGLAQLEVIANASTDAFLAQFPSARADRETRRFRITVEEI